MHIAELCKCSQYTFRLFVLTSTKQKTDRNCECIETTVSSGLCQLQRCFLLTYTAPLAGQHMPLIHGRTKTEKDEWIGYKRTKACHYQPPKQRDALPPKEKEINM